MSEMKVMRVSSVASPHPHLKMQNCPIALFSISLSCRTKKKFIKLKKLTDRTF